MLLQMALGCSVLWRRSIPLCVYTASSLALNCYFPDTILFSTVQRGDPVTHTCRHSMFSHYHAPFWPSCATVATPQTKPAISNNQRKVSSCCCLGALRPLLSSVLPSSVGVLHLTPWTRGEDMRGRVSQEEGRSGDAGGAQLGTERVSSLETPSCPGSAQAFRGNRSAPAAITNPMGNGA